MDNLTGHVAKILDDEEVVINLGKANGVETRMDCLIFRDYGTIYDPNTEEELGDLRRTKARAYVISVYEKFSILKLETSDLEEHLTKLSRRSFNWIFDGTSSKKQDKVRVGDIAVLSHS